MTHVLLRLVGLLMLAGTGLALLALAGGGLLPQDDIVFSASFSYDGSDVKIYRMDIRTRLTRTLSAGYVMTRSFDINPIWSPDGSQIAFVSKQSNEVHIYVMDAAGGNRRRLSNLYQYNFDPQWSPDGRWLAYVSTSNYINFQLMVDNVESGATERLVNQNYTIVRPSWSPDSQQIAFMGLTTAADIYTVNIHTKAVQLQASAADSSEEPAWSPDGSQIAFIAYDNRLTQSDLYTVMLGDGSLKSVAPATTDDQYPAWSPDGRYLLYTTNSYHTFALYDTMTATTQQLSTSDASIFGTAEWSSDGHYILYSAYDQYLGNSHIYRLNAVVCIQQAAACIPERLTRAAGSYSVADWRPLQP